MKADMTCLSYPLPEDILKRKWSGDLDGAARIIRRRLEGQLPDALRQRLEVELEALPILRANYCIPEPEAIALLTEKVRDFRPEELTQWRDDDWVDWMVIDGRICYISSFYDNLLKTQPSIVARQLHPPVSTKRDSGEIRDEAIAFLEAHGEARSRLRLRASIRLTRPEAGTPVRAWLPLPVVQDQITAVKLLATSQPPVHISDERYPQRTVYFEGVAGQTDEFWIEYELESRLPLFRPDPDKVSPVQPTFYTQEEAPHILFTPYLKALTAQVVGDEKNPLRIARRIYDFVTTQVKYSYMRSYSVLPPIPDYCLSRMRGDCGVQALCFITMCRIAGVPAKWQSGLHADENGAGCHDWAMFYVAPYGWMYCDPSFGGGSYRAGAMHRWDHYFCNLDPHRVVLASEFQMPYDPPMTYSRRDPYDNQDGEIEYATRAISRAEQDRETTCLSVEVFA
jgi:hypothetical protein